MRIQFNTNRHYTIEGQRIVAFYDPEGLVMENQKPTVFFKDHSRMIEGWFELPEDQIGSSKRSLRSVVTNRYDSNDYNSYIPPMPGLRGILNWRELETWYFTFGSGHLPGTDGYVVCHDMTYSEARVLMVTMVGDKFCTQYNEKAWKELKKELKWRRPVRCVRILDRSDLPGHMREESPY